MKDSKPRTRTMRKVGKNFSKFNILPYVYIMDRESKKKEWENRWKLEIAAQIASEEGQKVRELLGFKFPKDVTREIMKDNIWFYNFLNNVPKKFDN